MSFDSDTFVPPTAKIKVIGIGGGGGNAVNTMIRTNIEGVEFISANTDVQALRFSLAEKKIQIGKDLTKGLGAGADPDIGRDAMLEDRHAIGEALDGANMVFITAGMGGGTGTGGAAIAAQIARELGALTVGVVTKPFAFEGKRRRKHAEEGINRLREHVDTLITIPNQRLLQIASPDLSMIDAFRLADNVLVNAVKGISDIINIPGTVNVDFADVKTVMASMGMALMGIGIANGEGRSIEAARQAISSPLLEDVDIEGATGILINITAGEDVSLHEVNEACSIIQEAAHEDANIIFGAVIDEDIGDQVRVTVIATGFPVEDEIREQSSRSLSSGYDWSKRSLLKPSTPKPQLPEAEVDPAPRVMAKEEFIEDIIISNESSEEDEAYEQKLAAMTFSNEQDEEVQTSSEVKNTEAKTTEDSAPKPSRETLLAEKAHNEQKAEPERVGATSETESAGNDMDRKIDEALKMAEKISLDQKEDEEDDLEVPSFLRHRPKDLSLS